jgi:hypothetical protein
MARLRQLCSNEFLDTLADWNTILQGTSLAKAAKLETLQDDGEQKAANDGGMRKGPVNRITQRRQRL